MTPTPGRGITPKALQYDMVWTTRRNKGVLHGPVADRFEELVAKACKDLGVELIKMDVILNYVHLRVRIEVAKDAKTLLSAKQLVGKLKRLTAKHLRSEFKEIRKIPSMWTREQLIEDWELTSKDIREYLASKRGQEQDKRRENIVKSHARPG